MDHNITKKVLYIQTMGGNYKTKHHFLQTLLEKGVDLFTEYKKSVLDWAINVAHKDRMDALTFVENLTENDEKKEFIENMEKWNGKTMYPICVAWDCDGFKENLDDSPAPTQFWLFTIKILNDAGFEIDMAFSQYLGYAMDKNTFESLNGKKFMDEILPNIFTSDRLTPIVYVEPNMSDDDIKKGFEHKNLEHNQIKTLSRPEMGAWNGEYGGEAKEKPGQKAGSFYAWHEYLIKHPEIEMTVVYCWCNIAAGIASNVETRSIQEAHACMSSLANIQRKEFGLKNQVSILLIGDAKIAKSILVWKNIYLSKALKTWRENERTPDVTPEINPVVTNPEVSSTQQKSYSSSYEYTNSRDDYDSDTERELYRYSINPNSIYLD